MTQTRVVPQFVEYIPEHLEEGVLYVTQMYRTATHKCCCGCGEEVITPLNRADWSLTVAGGLVTLYPSIGNWSFRCQSHYWIRRGRVVWAAPMAQWEIDRVRAVDRANKAAYFREKNQAETTLGALPHTGARVREVESLWRNLWRTVERLLK